MPAKHDHRPWHILPVIILAQFAGTSLWFAGNAVAADLQAAFDLPAGSLGNITSAVQFGFICGTLVFAFLLIADRFSPSLVFVVCSWLGALANLGVYLFASDFVTILAFRFLTGFFLAGIYPVGMKIAADWHDHGLGKALGYLVGALVLGTAFPHFLRFGAGALPWSTIILATSVLAAMGGLLLYLTVPDGPHRRPGARFQLTAIRDIFRRRSFRAAAFGYFGHMWELYTVWAFVPVLLAGYRVAHPAAGIGVSLGSFIVISMGMLGCVLGGYVSLRRGSRQVAFFMLLLSGLACLLSPLLMQLSFPFFFAFLLIWGFAVVGDSPQFSTLVAQTAPREYVGSALTIVNSIGFAITIPSIELVNFAVEIAHLPSRWMFWLLLPGPLFGLAALWRLKPDANG